jgi:hypothetical protein
MSEFTVIQLMAAQRARELRHVERLGVWDVVVFPLFCLVAVCGVALFAVAGIAVLARQDVSSARAAIARMTASNSVTKP